MRYLLDTNVLIWMLEGSDKLSDRTRDIILNDDNEIYISTASLWEISIKVSLKKLKLAQSLNVFLDTVYGGDFTVVALESDYYKELQNLPSIHKDPFDRIIIATAMVENFILITSDENIRKYSVETI